MTHATTCPLDGFHYELGSGMDIPECNCGFSPQKSGDLKLPWRETPDPVWEFFCDESYYHLWAVRPIGSKSFQCKNLFHLPSQAEAEKLCFLLNHNHVAPR